jgi:anaerobic magnesium-protoporphyrin IX monomethyl ester cyclase
VTSLLKSLKVAEPRFLLMYSPLQFGPEEMAKPDGSLSLAYVAGSLRRAGYHVEILDVSVGGKEDRLEDTFFRTTYLESGLIRCGMSPERVAERIADFDVIGISSIFTAQTSMVLELARLVKSVDPRKLVIAGGVNARNLRDRFFRAGVDVIALSEAETTILEIAEAVRGRRQLASVRAIAFLDESGREVVTPPGPPLTDLDQLPFPAWDLLPLDKYWDISRPHGGEFSPGERLQYAALQTSRGCPYHCLYCHISKEDAGGISGAIGSYRMKSIERVLAELEILKGLGARYIYFEDDSLFAKKPRAYELFRAVKDMGLVLADVNGINLVHLLTNRGGRLEIDEEFLSILADAGFKWFHLPFESASQRLIDTYSTGKWNTRKTDTEKLIRKCNDFGLSVAGNYMIGYPDETLDEIYSTVLMAKRHVLQGLNHAALFAVVPFPGTEIFDMVIRNGQLDPDFDTDQMKWTKSILKGLAVPPETLEHLRQLAWLTVNKPSFVDYKIAMRVNRPIPAPAAGPRPPLQQAFL